MLTIFPVIQSLTELPIGVLNVQDINNMKDLLKNEIGPIDFPDVIQHPIYALKPIDTHPWEDMMSPIDLNTQKIKFCIKDCQTLYSNVKKSLLSLSILSLMSLSLFLSFITIIGFIYQYYIYHYDHHNYHYHHFCGRIIVIIIIYNNQRRQKEWMIER